MKTLIKSLMGNRQRADGNDDRPVARAFEEATEEVLGCLRGIISGRHGIDKPRIDLLKELGFTSCNDVVSWERAHQLLCNETKKIDDVRYYATRYPLIRFILFQQVSDICKRFGYVCIPVTAYGGKVPESAFADMVEFSVHDDDIWYSNYPYNIIEFNSSRRAVHKSMSQVKANPQVIQTQGGVSEDEEPVLVRLPFFICTVKSGRKETGIWANKRATECIVLHPVPGGFLIVTKWTVDKESEVIAQRHLELSI